MINPFLAARLQPVIRRRRQRQLALGMALWWGLAALSGWALFLRGQPPLSTEYLPDFVVISLLGALAVWLLWYLMPVSFRGMARRIERRFPALDGRLLTAVQVDEEDEKDGEGKPAFIRERLLSQAMQHSVDHDWSKAAGAVSGWKSAVLAAAAVVAFAMVLGSVPRELPGLPLEEAAVSEPEASVKLADGVEVTPGDTVLEKGSSLVVLVKFSQSVPESVSLVATAYSDLLSAAAADAKTDTETPADKGKARERRVNLSRSLRDPVFGGSLPGVTEDFRYHIEYAGRSTREFTVKVFEYPRLEQSDVLIRYPEWTALPDKRVEDTRRVSAVEGSRISLELRLNKPVVSALLKPRDAGAREIPLEASADKPSAGLKDYALMSSGTYELILKDAEGRTNRTPPVFTFEALPNTAPEIKLAQPRGDQTPSPLEELVFTGTARDDFGLLAWGLAFTMGGGDPEYLELGKEAKGGEMRNFDHLLRLEEKGAKPDDLVSWFVWADDIGPDGKRRRTEGDLFFGEVREFDQIFRRGQDQSAAQQQQQQQQEGGAGQQGPGAKLAELQKQIINATWKLRRSAAPAKADITVVSDSQKEVVTQAEEAASEAEDARLAALWEKAKAAVKKASDSLLTSVEDPGTLAVSLAAEQSAYQALLKLQAKEFEITRNQRASSGASQSEAQRRMQEELNEMELAEEKNRYETESEARAQQEAERREDRQVVNRLQELAKRQEEVNERLKELQTALQAAETPEEKEALERELKRLEEEQRETLADVDELNQRMQRPENQSRMSQERERLEEARENAREASEQAAQGNAAQALTAGTRAQRQLQEMREELRNKASGGFSEDLREMRAEARELASEQRKVNEQLKQMDAESARKTLGGDSERDEALKTLAEQKRRSEQLTKRAAEISESAESAEPLVSRQLYDSMRKYAQDDAAGVKQAQEELLRNGDLSRQMYRQLQEMQNREEGAKTLDLTSDLLSEDLVAQAQSTGRSAESGIEDFKRGIERAVESVVGDDTEALKRAERELESLTRDLATEIAQATGEPAPMPGEARTPNGNRNRNQNQSGEGEASRENENPGVLSQSPRGNQPGAEQASQEQSGRGEPGQEQGQGREEGREQGQEREQGQDPAERQGRQGGERSVEGQTAEAGQPQEGRHSVDQDPQTPGQSPAEGQDGRQPGQSGNSRAGQPGQAQSQGQENSPLGQGREPSAEQAQGEGPNGQSPSDGQGQGQEPSRGEEPGQQGQEPEQGQAQGQGQGGGEDAGQESGAPQGQDSPESPGREGQQNSGNRRAGGNNSSSGGGGSRGGSLNAGGRGGLTNPLAGDDYGQWSDGLRDVQELVEFPDLRNRIADARENARRFRVDTKRDLKKPDWAEVRTGVLEPLVEVRKQVREELLRRQSSEALVPIDRDPVPGRYSEQVRRYYEQLGKD